MFLFRFSPLVELWPRLGVEVGDQPPLAHSAEIGQDPLTVWPFRIVEAEKVVRG
jgi:hypothetical protein